MLQWYDELHADERFHAVKNSMRASIEHIVVESGSSYLFQLGGYEGENTQKDALKLWSDGYRSR